MEHKPLFGELIAAHDGLAEELSAIDSIALLEQQIQNEEAFTRIFKHKLTSPTALGAGLWQWNELTQRFEIKTSNGGVLALKFFDTVKKVFDYQNIEIPGKESYLSYIEVVVRPAGIKGYMFRSDQVQAVWGDSRSKALVKHEKNIAMLLAKAKGLGFELTAEQWRHNFDRTTY